MNHALSDLAAALEMAAQAQDAATETWHTHEAPADADFSAPAPWNTAAHESGNPVCEALRPLVLRQHLMNFRLWHKEDEARRVDVDDAVIAGCKRFIDRHNQLRNDGMERIDAFVTEEVTRRIPSQGARCNTESVGMIVDRLSILSLKIFHMREETCRTDADEAHRTRCTEKLAVLCEQRDDLRTALADLVADFAAGTKSPKLYRQFKMYNDPSLNPCLYAKRGQEQDAPPSGA